MEDILRKKIEETNNKINQLMTNAIQAQTNHHASQPEDLLNSSAERPGQQARSNSALVHELISNINGLANIDLTSFAGNNDNLTHLLKATNHLKIA
jgi:hypothetical protein